MRIASVVLVAILSSTGASGGAQAARVMTAQAGPLPASGILKIDRPITVRFEAVPLAEAVQTIVRQTGAQVSYRATILPSHHRVTLAVTNSPGRTVLERVLRSTGVAMSVAPTGEVALYPVPSVDRKAKAQGV